MRSAPSLLDLLDAGVAGGPDRPAIISSSNTTMSYGEISRRSAAAAHALADAGARPGDVIATLLPGDGAAVVLLAACARAGLIAAPVNALLWPRERRGAIDVCRPALVVTHPEFVDDCEGRPTIEVDPETGASELWSSGLTEHDDHPDPPGSLWFTSATTGEPRAVLISEQPARHEPTPHTDARPQADRRHLCAVDISQFGGRRALLHALDDQLPLQLMGAWSRNAFTTALGYDGPPIDTLTATGPQLNTIVRKGPTPWNEQLRRVEIVGGFASQALLRAVAASPCQLTIRYGSAETAGVATSVTSDQASHPLHVGTTHPGFEIVIRSLDPDAHGRIVDPGELGQIEIRGPHVPSSYWNDPGASRRAFPKPGVFCSGDLGVAHSDGSFSLYGRLGDRFTQDGHVVDPAAVETALAADPAVSEVAVVPRPHAEFGSIGVAVTVPFSPDHPPFLHELVSGSNLAPKVSPRAQWVVDALPLSGSGTIQRRRLVYEESTR